MRNFTIFVVLLWFFGAFIAGWYGLFSEPDTSPAYLGLFLLLPDAFFLTLYFSNKNFRALANSIELSLIVWAHLWRFVGIGFLIAFLFGKLPAQFAIPEGLGDIVAAVFAFPLALALRHKRPVRRYFVIWNIFGLADLISAITMGILYAQGPLGILRTEVSTALMTTFPVNLIPTFFVPLFIMLHVLALARRGEVAATAAST